MAKGIYKLTNNRTGEVYVGQTNNLYYREKQHEEDLASGTHHNRRMQQDYNRGDRFSFEVLEYVDGSRNELHEREMAQIRNHNSFYAGYNQTPGGEYDQLKGSYQYGGGRKYTPPKRTTTRQRTNSYKQKNNYKPMSNTMQKFGEITAWLFLFAIVMTGLMFLIPNQLYLALFNIILWIFLIIVMIIVKLMGYTL